MLLGASVLDIFFFFDDTATTEIYTLSLHDALPIFDSLKVVNDVHGHLAGDALLRAVALALRRRLRQTDFAGRDRKSTRLNSSHTVTSYAVFCLKKKKEFGRRIDFGAVPLYVLGALV